MTDKDKLATYIGGAAGIITAAQVAVQQMPAGTSMHMQDWLQLAFAAIMGFFGWITNKK